MSKSKMISARIEPEIKQKADEIFDSLGLSASQAISLFYTQVGLHRGLPFEVELPALETMPRHENAARTQDQESRPRERTPLFRELSELLGYIKGISPLR